MALEELSLQLILLVIAFFANLISAFAGGGAGLLQLPALILMGLPFPIALATHKVASVALGIGAGFRHLQRRTLRLGFVILILAFGLPGVWLGAKTTLLLPNDLAITCLGILTLGVGFYSLNCLQSNSGNEYEKYSLQKLIVGGLGIFLIGCLNGSFSSGTGLFVTLWLVRWFGLSYTQAVAYTLTLVGLLWNGTGAFVLGISQPIKWNWIPVLVVGSLFGGYCGAQLSIDKGNKLVKSAFEFLCFAMGGSLVLRSLL